MDNRTFDVTSVGSLKNILAIAFANAPGGKATHMVVQKPQEITRYFKNHQGEVDQHENVLLEHVDGTPTLILCWHEDKGTIALPFPLDEEGAEYWIQQWLKNADYGPEPDHDGHNKPGWRAFCTSWGQVGDRQYAFLAIQPEWACYGK